MYGRRSDASRREPPRLPVIAPREETQVSLSDSPSRLAARGDSQQTSSRTRLPPRSRSGCWTCRTRKVKCDERRPTCGQCARLGHSCDYNPRLAFKDDTRRVIERMQDINTEGNSVWDPQSLPHNYGSSRSQDDLLPAFSALTTDEEREQKAELQQAGTYMVIANPGSFANLPEYCEDEVAAIASTASDAKIDMNADTSQSTTPNTVDPWDPNTIILGMFESTGRRMPLSLHPDLVLPVEPAITLKPSYHHTEWSHSQNITAPFTWSEEAHTAGQDEVLLKHYREHISRRVIHVGSLEEEDPFEVQARTFPPLFHAILAISALSIAHLMNTQSTDALDHYQQVLPAMRISVTSEEDSISDASAGPWESNLWQTHSVTLQRIIKRRMEVNGTESHSFLVWVICMADVYALLSGSGSGEFAEFIMKNNYIKPHECLPRLGTLKLDTFFPEEVPYFPELLEMNQQVAWLALRVGITAHDLRTQWEQRHANEANSASHEVYIDECKNRVNGLQALCRESPPIWQARYPHFWSWQPAARHLPWRVRGFWDHSYALYRACVIYLHTSMYPGQIANPNDDDNYSVCATEIIDLAVRIVEEERWECQFIILSLFIAGVASKVPSEKILALDMMTELAQHSYGGNTATIRQLLRVIYSKQQAAALDEEYGGEIDWIGEMRKMGLRLVMFGM